MPKRILENSGTYHLLTLDFIVARFELELAVSVVSKTITDIDHCTSTDVTLQHNGRPDMR